MSHSRSADTQVGVERHEGVATITLDGAKTRNALDAASAEALVEACDAIDADASIGVVVVRGAHRTFCSGAARSSLDGLRDASSHVAYEGLSALYAAFARVGRLTVPSIARIEGAAVGAGLNLALATDVRVAASDAQLVSGFAPLGLHPGGGHLHLLARAGGAQAAAGMGLFGARLSGTEAEAAGLVWAAAPAPALDDLTDTLVGHLAADPDLARALKSSYRLTCLASDGWAAATEVERARQMWSMTRPRTLRPPSTQDRS